MTHPRSAILRLFTVVACSACARVDAAESDGPLIRELRDVAPVAVRWNVQLSVESSPSGCAQTDSLSLAELRCEAGPISRQKLTRLASVAGKATEALEADVNVDALHAATVVDLLMADTAGKVLDRSISRLEMVTRLAPDRASGWQDLSAAYLMRASARGEGRALVAALDAASRALELDSTNAAASYNRAISLDLLALDVEATREWQRFLRLSPRSSWAPFARARLAATSSVRQPVAPSPASPPDSLRAFVTAHSFEARLFAWESLLGGWGEATLAGDSGRARERLTAASVIGDDIAARFGDSSLVSAIASIQWVTDSRATRQLAEAHAAYARGRTRTRTDLHAVAERDFAAVLANPATPPALRDWATLSRANALLFLQNTDDAKRLAMSVAGRIDGLSHPSLAGRAWWMLAVIAFRSGRDDEGLAANTQARRFSELAGERDNVTATASILGERALRLGDDDGFSTMVPVMRGLRWYPTGNWRHNALYILASNSTRIGLDRSAMAFADEDAASATGTRAALIAELRLIRARALWESGDSVRAHDALTLASHTIDSLPDEVARGFFGAELAFTRAVGPMSADGERPLRMLDTVVAFHEPARRANKLIPALVARARVALGLDHVDEAEADLDRAAHLYGLQRESITSLPERAALLSRAREVHERLSLLRLGRGDERGALEILERGRLSFAGVTASTRKPPEAADYKGTIVDFALIGDTLVTWTLAGRNVHAARTPVPRDSLLDTIERVRAAMELQVVEAAAQPPLARLYDWLIRPLEGGLATDSAIVTIVSEGMLAEVPFAALYDTARGDYLIQKRPLRWAATLADARRGQLPTVGSRALVVSSPALDYRVFQGLSPLPGAQLETDSVATFFAKPVRLSGQEADSASVVTALESAGHFHFAGHALFDDARPNRSRLAVLPRGIDAVAIAKLDLRKLRLAVLSACETTRAPERRGAGFTGLTEAFLAAGTGGVLGTLWPVDDQHTRAFMSEFYRAYRDGGNAAMALRDAQLRMLQSTGAARRPSAWAGFRLAGR